ncbi:hypothetical protein FISHEDRAFT_72995 [Fistulina hepatica ATCC 64428]|uniref:Uncharacterized protein n=1 Tax=Fistulina hepatica ATCC 64428 TaxID=1128425 RepID=A0A0D7AED0_9AGAR|nr:hypothetical protein FISHEDRAFT_72995 [Fistulina hepatica ATCC 64428]
MATPQLSAPVQAALAVLRTTKPRPTLYTSPRRPTASLSKTKVDLRNLDLVGDRTTAASKPLSSSSRSLATLTRARIASSRVLSIIAEEQELEPENAMSPSRAPSSCFSRRASAASSVFFAPDHHPLTGRVHYRATSTSSGPTPRFASQGKTAEPMQHTPFDDADTVGLLSRFFMAVSTNVMVQK